MRPRAVVTRGRAALSITGVVPISNQMCFSELVSHRYMAQRIDTTGRLICYQQKRFHIQGWVWWTNYPVS